MNRNTAIIAATCLAAVLSGGCGRTESRAEDRIFDDQTREFFSKIDVEALRLMASQFGGRTAGTLDSLAHESISKMTGTETPDGVASVLAYTELYFNTGKYLNKPVIYVKAKKLRDVIADHLHGKHLATLQRTGRIPPVAMMLYSHETLAELAVRNENVYDMLNSGRITIAEARLAGPVGTLKDEWKRLFARKDLQVVAARLATRYEAFLEMELRVIPSGAGDWCRAEEIFEPGGEAGSVPGSDLVVALRDAWRKQDASKVNAIVAQLDQAGRKHEEEYPGMLRRKMELLYNDAHKGHAAFVGFVVAFLLMIAAISTGRGGFRKAALAIMTLSTLVLGAAWVIRWIVGGEKWYLPPMMSQYEALISSALLGAVLGLVIEFFRKYNYIALAASFYAAMILIWVYFGNALFPGKVDSSLGAVKGILKHWLMIIHVSTIVVGHALAGMTVVTSLAYVMIASVRGLGDKRPSSPPGLFGPVGDSPLAAVDRSNLILAQVACWMLVAGTLLGAWWGDRAWSRWWGWDAKETWALITCLIFIAAVHVRFITSTRWRGLITAFACLLGGAAMLFNWFGVSYVFKGLHSYG